MSIVTLRADFYDRPLQHRGPRRAAPRRNRDHHPDDDAASWSARSPVPAEQHGVTFDPALVAELVRDVSDRPGALPLLQYTLTELFDEPARATASTYAAYEASWTGYPVHWSSAPRAC